MKNDSKPNSILMRPKTAFNSDFLSSINFAQFSLSKWLMKQTMDIFKGITLVVIMLSMNFTTANAQEHFSCGFIHAPQHINSFSSVHEARDVVGEIMDKADWAANFVIQEKNGINNAYATIYGGKRYIVYDNNFLETIDFWTGTKWASISIMAHEVGHHYHHHVLGQGGSSHDRELEADRFSGFMMAKMGASLKEAQAAMGAIASENDSHSHPAKDRRLRAIADGWQAAFANTSTNTNTNKPHKPQSPTNTHTDHTHEKEMDWIHLENNSDYTIHVQLSDDGKNYQTASIEPNKKFVFMYEIYNYGWVKLTTRGKTITYKLRNGDDYYIDWNYRRRQWDVFASN